MWQPLSAGEDLIPWVNQLFAYASEQQASDIHLEAQEKNYRLRLRQDGLLYPLLELPLNIAHRVITRLKVMANLDISEKRLPQDGRFSVKEIAHPLEARLSSCPTLHGEKIVLRLQDQKPLALAIESLGFNPEQENLFRAKLAQPQGLILVTGPTGSGKTATLYSALQALNASDKNIVTVEDPIEIPLQGINQVQIHPKLGLDYATVLRAFLRQDPDIILVGEIRDKETAAIALEAAQTGHLVLASLHTNSALESLGRLKAMGAEAYQLVPALGLIIAERLLRLLCPLCKKYESSSASFVAQGCKQCLQGYRGRRGLFEVIDLNDSLAQGILEKVDSLTLLKMARNQGFSTLWEEGLKLVQNGLTSLFELKRVLQA